MAKAMQQKIIHAQTDTINGLTQSQMTAETKAVALGAELKLKIDIQNQLSVSEKFGQELLNSKNRLQSQLETTADFIAEL